VRIGIVSQSYYPRFGGVTEHVHNTAVELARRGHEVTIVTSRFRGEPPRQHRIGLERVGYNVLIPFNRAFVDFTIGFRLKRELRKLFERHAFDILHTHCPISPTLPILAIQAATCPQVATFHSTGGAGVLQDTFQDFLSRIVGRLDARVAVSQTAAATAQAYYPGHYEVIPNGVDVERFHTSLAPFADERQPGILNLLFVGRLDPRKGVHTLITAMPEIVARTNGKVRLFIVGDSYLRARFEASVPSEVKDKVRFLGHVPLEDLPRWYRTADVFISPASGNESFGIVLLEAMASGCPVVASDIPGYRSVVIPDDNGILVPPENASALAAAVSALAQDPERRRQLATRGRQRALEFAWPRVTDRIEAVYREVLSRRSAVHTAA
jgi:phosphatidyl-myo-inositol alpha-mannosyltransferase